MVVYYSSGIHEVATTLCGHVCQWLLKRIIFGQPHTQDTKFMDNYIHKTLIFWQLHLCTPPPQHTHTQNEKIDPDKAIVMIPRTSIKVPSKSEPVEETDSGSPQLKLGSMEDALLRGARKKQDVKTRGESRYRAAKLWQHFLKLNQHWGTRSVMHPRLALT